MNHEPPEPFGTVGDEHVEARLVAWVLGEASAFEVAELERLCAERPELRIFRRRMQALHGLVSEAAAAEGDRTWQLPPEKRQAVEAVLGAGAAAGSAVRDERHIRRSGRRALWGVAACLAVTLVVLGILRPRLGDDARSAAPLAVRQEMAEIRDGAPEPAAGKAKRDRADASKRRLQLQVESALASDPFAPADGPSQSTAGYRIRPTGRSAEEVVAKDLYAGRELLAEQPAALAGAVAEMDDLAENVAPSSGVEELELAQAPRSRAAAADYSLADKLSSLGVPREWSGMPGDEFAPARRYAGERGETKAEASFGRVPNLVPGQYAAYADPFAEPALPPDETAAALDPFSTFSLNVGDASFQLAKAAVAGGGRPPREQIKAEQFYNAVDYGDPAPVAGEPVAATIEQCAHPVAPGRNLVRIALRTASAGRAAAQPLRLTLLIDQSGSMVREDRRAAMDHALGQLAGLLTAADRVTVVGFSRTPRLLADGAAPEKLAEIVNQAASEGGTNLEEALALGSKMAERQQLAGAQNRVVLFTDGAANLGNADPAKLEGQVQALRQKGIAFDVAGIGTDGLNDRLLAPLARHGDGRYYVVGAERDDQLARQLAGAFRPAAEDVKVQVRFNPQRVGNYKLLGFDDDRLRTEDFRNDAVDAAELAADESGIALYQVQPLPDGTGELGEVSIRFRDAATGSMVERSWTIPYDATASAFDRATPSMQLAGLALLAAEKLRGGPAAGAIDFQELAGSIATVRRFYRHSPRVVDLLELIGAL